MSLPLAGIDRGGDFTVAMAFEFASTNLVVEVGIVMAVLLSWQFTLAEFVGGPLMIVILQMGNDAWTTVAVRLVAFSVLPVLLAALHVRLDAGAKGRLRRAEVYLIYLFMLGVAASGLSGFFGHLFAADAVAESIDWPKGSPFQQEMGFANLALGVLGLIAAGRRDAFERRR